MTGEEDEGAGSTLADEVLSVTKAAPTTDTGSASAEDASLTVPKKPEAKQRDLRGFFGMKVPVKRAAEPSAVEVAPLEPQIAPDQERDDGPAPVEVPDEPEEAVPKERRGRKPTTDIQDEEGPAEAEAGTSKPRRKPKAAKNEDDVPETASADEPKPAKAKKAKADVVLQRGIMSFFGKPKAEAEQPSAVSAPAPLSDLDASTTAPTPEPSRSSPEEPAPELSLEEDIQIPEAIEDEDEDYADPAPSKKSTRKLRARKSTEAVVEEEPEPPARKKRSTKASGAKPGRPKKTAKGSVPVPAASGSTVSQGVISVDTDSESESLGTTGSPKVVVPSIPGDRDIFTVPDFFLTAAEKIRKKQLVAQKAAREEVEKHSKEAAVFAQKQLGTEAASAGHWFFEKRTAVKGDESGPDGEPVIAGKALEGIEAPFPSAENMHFLGSTVSQLPLTNSFGTFPLSPGPSNPIALGPSIGDSNQSDAAWTAFFGAVSREEAELGGPLPPEIRRMSLDSLLHYLRKEYAPEILGSPACARLLDMLSSGSRIEAGEGSELWVDRYRPRVASEVLGNTDVVAELASWMEKRKVDLEQLQLQARKKPKKRMEGKPKKAKKRGRRAGDLDDFIADSDSDSGFDSEGGETLGAASAVLLVGPCGSGKTAMVGAVAAQLGYSILEINEGQKRDSRSVLNEIGEATVNHTLVAGSAGPREELASEPPKEKAKPKPGLADLFVARQLGAAKHGSKTMIATSDDDDKGPVTKRKRTGNNKVVFSDSEEEMPSAPEQAASRPALDEAMDAESSPMTGEKRKRVVKLRLSQDAPVEFPSAPASTSFLEPASKPAAAGQTLIVFDNVDIVYEEDKGLWSAIATMAERSRRPIVLTAASSDVLDQLPPSLAEGMIVREASRPSSELMSAYIHLVCLLEGVWVDKSELLGLVERCDAEVGRSLRAVEFASVISRLAQAEEISGTDERALAVCKLSRELADPEILFDELGQPGRGITAKTSGILGILDRTAKRVLGTPERSFTIEIVLEAVEEVAEPAPMPSKLGEDAIASSTEVDPIMSSSNDGDTGIAPEPLMADQPMDSAPTEAPPVDLLAALLFGETDAEMAPVDNAGDEIAVDIAADTNVEELTGPADVELAPVEAADDEVAGNLEAPIQPELDVPEVPEILPPETEPEVADMPESKKSKFIERETWKFRKQIDADRSHLEVVDAYASQAELASAWDSDIHSRLALHDFLMNMPEMANGEDSCLPRASPMVPAFAVGKPELFGAAATGKVGFNTYFSASALAVVTEKLGDSLCSTKLGATLGTIEQPHMYPATLWTEAKEHRTRDAEFAAVTKIIRASFIHLMREDILRWSPRSIALEAAPLVDKILRSDKFRLEHDVGSGDEGRGRRRLTRASKQKRRYFNELLDVGQIEQFLETRDGLVAED